MSLLMGGSCPTWVTSGVGSQPKGAGHSTHRLCVGADVHRLAVSVNLLYGCGQCMVQSQEIDWCAAIEALGEPGAAGGKQLRTCLAAQGTQSMPLIACTTSLPYGQAGIAQGSSSLFTSLADCPPPTFCRSNRPIRIPNRLRVRSRWRGSW